MRSWNLRRRSGFSLLELAVVLMIAGVVGGLSVGRLRGVITEHQVARAATALQNDLEGAFAIAGRNRRPVRITWDATKMQMLVTDRLGTTVYRRTGLGRGAYGLSASGVTVSPSKIEIYPNGLATDELLVTLSSNQTTKRVKMTRAGLVQIQ